jgi:hypothetical protein
MPMSETLAPRDLRGRTPNEDALGFDRTARALLRAVLRLGPGTIAHVQGAPGAGKTEFLRRCLHLVETDRELLGAEVAADYQPHVVWFHAGAYARHGAPLLGLLAAIARANSSNPSLAERARDVAVLLGRMRFDGGASEQSVGLSPLDADPVDRLRRTFATLIDGARSSPRGRLLVLIPGADALGPSQRLAFLEGLRFLASAAPEAVFVVGIGREAAYAAVRAREGEVPEAVADRVLDELSDVAVTVPKLEVRRIGALLRRLIGSGEVSVREAFGDDAILVLAAACARRALGGPRLLERLAARAVLLSEFALETRMTRELGEAEWAWVVVSERWSEFRRFMIRGGRDRWLQLKLAVGRIGAEGELPSGVPGAPGAADVDAWLHSDLLLADYLRDYAEAFETNLQGIFWIDDVLLQAGL